VLIDLVAIPGRDLELRLAGGAVGERQAPERVVRQIHLGKGYDPAPYLRELRL